MSLTEPRLAFLNGWGEKVSGAAVKLARKIGNAKAEDKQGSSSASQIIYFVHVPKTAGTSLRKLFTTCLDPNSIVYVYLPPGGMELQELLALPQDRLDSLRAVYGHFPYGIDHQLKRPGKYLTCLRETTSQLVSNYHEHVRGGFVGGLSLLNYFNTWRPKDMDNYTVRLLAGVGHDVAFGGMTDDHLRQAQKNLDEEFAAFGIYEYLSESVARFCQLLDLDPIEVGRENVTPATTARQPIPIEEISILVKHNTLDQQLYDHAKDKFLRG